MTNSPVALDGPEPGEVRIVHLGAALVVTPGLSALAVRTASATTVPVPVGGAAKTLVVGQNSIAGVRLFESQTEVVRILVDELGPTKVTGASICNDKVHVQLARWGALSLVFAGSRLVDFIYNYGGWGADRAAGAGTPGPPPKGTVVVPLVETSGGATVGDTVAQVRQRDPSAKIPVGGRGGTPAYLIDGNILFLIQSSKGLVSSIQPNDRIAAIEEEGGNC